VVGPAVSAQSEKIDPVAVASTSHAGAERDAAPTGRSSATATAADVGIVPLILSYTASEG
jgi:hypothetical protein